MAITRADVEAILIKRCGKLMMAAGMDGTTIAGSNADLNDPIGNALRLIGYSISSIANVRDSDVGAIRDDEIDKLLDVAELRTLESIEGNLDQVDMTVGPRSESHNQLVTRLQRKIEMKRAAIAKQYGMMQGSLSGGVVSLDFAETTEDEW